MWARYPLYVARVENICFNNGLEFPRLSPAGGERAIAMLMPAFAMLIAVVVGLPTPPQPATPRNATIAAAAVFRIEVHAVSPFYLRPWEKSAQQRRLGTGFLAEGQRLLTNFHVVEDAVDIRLSKAGASKRWRARVAAVGPDVDLATLQVTHDAEGFFKGLEPVVWSDELPALQSRVTVRGYPTGGSTQCVTEGVVSRVDCKNYRLGHTAAAAPGDLLVVQIDAAINGGNSGGPCFDASHRVVGVAFQGIDGAQSIGYIIPALLARSFLAATQSAVPGSAATTPIKYNLIDVPFRFEHLENRGLRRYLRVPENVTGVVISAVSPLSALAPRDGGESVERKGFVSPVGTGGVRPSAALAEGERNSLRADDVLTAIDGVPIGDDGTVLLRPGERVKVDWLITSKMPGSKTTELEILRSGMPITIRVDLRPLPPPLPRWHDYDCQPEWVVIGGLLFAPLTAPLVEAASDQGTPAYVHDVWSAEVSGQHAFRRDPQREVVVLLDVLNGGDVNYGYEGKGWRVLHAFNGITVNSLAELYVLWQRAQEQLKPFLEFEFSRLPTKASSSRIVLAREAVTDAESLILRLHGMPSSVSPGVLRAVRESRLHSSGVSGTRPSTTGTEPRTGTGARTGAFNSSSRTSTRTAGSGSAIFHATASVIALAPSGSVDSRSKNSAQLALAQTVPVSVPVPVSALPEPSTAQARLASSRDASVQKAPASNHSHFGMPLAGSMLQAVSTMAAPATPAASAASLPAADAATSPSASAGSEKSPPTEFPRRRRWKAGSSAGGGGRGRASTARSSQRASNV